MEYAVGDIVLGGGGNRLRIIEIYIHPEEDKEGFRAGWAAFEVIRKDGQRDNRSIGWTGILKGLRKEDSFSRKEPFGPYLNDFEENP